MLRQNEEICNAIGNTFFRWSRAAAGTACAGLGGNPAGLLAEAGFRYGRTTANLADVTANENPLALASSCHFHNWQFWKIFEEAKKTGVFYFWGHSYEMMEYPPLWDRFEQKIKALSEDPEVEWVDVIDLPDLLHKNQTAPGTVS